MTLQGEDATGCWLKAESVASDEFVALVYGDADCCAVVVLGAEVVFCAEDELVEWMVFVVCEVLVLETVVLWEEFAPAGALLPLNA